MTRKKKFLIALGVVLAIALVSGISIYAATTYGTSSDPLVTLSYLNEKFKPQILDDLEEQLTSSEDSVTQSLNEQISGFTATIDSMLDGSSPVSEADTFSVVTLKSGQTVTCSVGAEIMLRIGTATGYGPSSPALIDTTSGGTLSSGSALTTNHMYMVTIDGNGVKATASTVKILIRGTYSIS